MTQIFLFKASSNFRFFLLYQFSRWQHLRQVSLNRDFYIDWIDMVQGHAIEHDIWKFIDPNNMSYHLEPQKPIPSDYKAGATRFADLDKDQKEMFKEDSAQYRVDIQSYKQECRLIGELRAKIVESLHESHSKLIFGHMTCREVLRQIRDRLEPAEDLQRLKVIDDFARIRVTPNSRKIDGWLMNWERTEIMIKRLKIADFSDYKLTQDFLSAANPLQPIWVTSKRMEILKVADKTNLKFLDVLIEFRQF